MSSDDAANAARKAALRTLAHADRAALRRHWETIVPEPAHSVLRGPEAGLVMVRGRIGGGGGPFNVGEATMTRCVVRLDSGEVGFGHILGRDGERARLVALFDALGTSPAYQQRVREAVIVPLAAAQEAAAAQRAAEVAATKVNFFTMARGED